MSKIVQMKLSDLEVLFRKIAGEQSRVIGVSRSKTLKLTGMTDWELRKAVEANPNIKIGNNRYNVNILKTA